MKQNLLLVMIIATIVATLAYLTSKREEIPTSIKVVPANKNQKPSIHEEVMQKRFLHLSHYQ